MAGEGREGEGERPFHFDTFRPPPAQAPRRATPMSQSQPPPPPPPPQPPLPQRHYSSASFGRPDMVSSRDHYLTPAVANVPLRRAFSARPGPRPASAAEPGPRARRVESSRDATSTAFASSKPTTTSGRVHRASVPTAPPFSTPGGALWGVPRTSGGAGGGTSPTTAFVDPQLQHHRQQQQHKQRHPHQLVTVSTTHRFPVGNGVGGGAPGPGPRHQPATERAIQTTLDLLPPWLVALVPPALASAGADRGGGGGEGEASRESLQEMHAALVARLPGPSDAAYDPVDAFGLEQSLQRLSPDNLRRFELQPGESAYLYRCLAGFSAGFHDAVAECTRRATVEPNSGGGGGGRDEGKRRGGGQERGGMPGRVHAAEEDEGEEARGRSALNRRLLLSSVWRVYAALWEAEMGGTFDCSVLGVIRDAQADAAARVRSEGDLTDALERVEAERRRADAAAEGTAQARKSIVVAECMQNALGGVVGGMANEREAKEIALKEVLRLQDASRKASLEYARQRLRTSAAEDAASHAKDVANHAKDAAAESMKSAEDYLRRRRELEEALAAARGELAKNAEDVAAAVEAAAAIHDERKTHARSVALFRGDNELLRERLAAAEGREAGLRVDLAALCSAHASTTAKLRADCQRRQAALETSRSQNAVLVPALAAARKESAEREAARLALETSLAVALVAVAEAAEAAGVAEAAAAATLETQRRETASWQQEAKAGTAALATLRSQHRILLDEHDKIRKAAGGLAESVERLHREVEVGMRASAAAAVREAGLRDDLAAGKVEISRLKLALDAEKSSHAAAVSAATATAAVAARTASGFVADAMKREELIAKYFAEIETLRIWQGTAESTMATLTNDLKKHKVAALLTKAVGESKEGAGGRRLRECETQLEEATTEVARLAAAVRALQRELERTREEAMFAAEVAAHHLAHSQAGERESAGDLAQMSDKLRQAEAWLHEWDEHTRRAMKRATQYHPAAAAAAEDFSVAAEQARVLYNQPGGGRREGKRNDSPPPPEIPLLQRWSGDVEGLRAPPSGGEPGPPPPRAQEGGAPLPASLRAFGPDAVAGPPDDRLEWLGQEAKRLDLAIQGAGELFRRVTGELDAARMGGRTGRSAMLVLKVALRFRIDEQV